MAAPRYQIGDRVEDRESGKRGRVMYVYRTVDLRDDVVVVLFNSDIDALAYPVTGLRKLPRKRGRRS